MKKLIVSVCTLLTVAGQAQLGNQMVVCMPMDNNSASDFSGYNNHGSLVNVGAGITPTTGHLGVASTGFHFNGSSYINISTSPSINGIEVNDELSISIWCKVNSWHSGSPVFPMVERKHSVNDDGWQFNLLNSSTFPCDIHFGNGLSMLNVYPGTASIPVGNNVWQHYVMIYSITGNYCRLYVNGSLVGNNTLVSPQQIYNTNNGPIRIGFSEAGTNEYANGDMDDLRIWRRAITAAEVSMLYTDQTISCTTESVTPDPDPVNEGCCLGNKCSDSQNALVDDYEIPMAGFNFNYTMPQQSPSRVLIGQQTCGTASARLDVRDDVIGTGVKGYCGTSKADNIGVYGSAIALSQDPTSISIGVLGDGVGRDEQGQARQYGVVGFAGTAAIPAMPPMPQSVGVYGNSIANNGTWAGYFDGDVNFNGDVWNSQFGWVGSDRRFKSNIKSLENVSDKIGKLNGYTYNLKKDEFKSKNFSDKEQIGFIAQELQEVFPQLVKEDKQGYLAVNYEGMVPVLLQAIKEQNELNQNQQKQIDALKDLVNKMVVSNSGAGKNGGTTGIAINLSDKNAIVLNQNVPNPFAESTIITYNIPSDFSRAQIVFMTNDGRVIKSVEIKEKGQGSLSVFADDLTNGIYSYMLVIDGKTIDTKKMIKN